MEGIWERVLLAEVSELGKPGVLDAVVEDVQPMLVEDVGGAEECYHMEEGVLHWKLTSLILVLVDQSWGREGAG